MIFISTKVMTVFDSWMNLVPKTSWKKRFKRNKSTNSVHIGIKFNQIVTSVKKNSLGSFDWQVNITEHAWLAMIEYIHHNIIDLIKVLLS